MRNKEAIENLALVLRSQSGDREAFSKLIDIWQPRLWRHASYLLNDDDSAADCVQETWVAVVNGLSRLSDAAAFPKWAYTILANKCNDHLRRKMRLGETSVQEALEIGADDPHRHYGLHDALSQLAGEQRALLSLYYADGFAIAEIAEILGIPEGTVKSRLHSARERLKALMERAEDE